MAGALKLPPFLFTWYFGSFRPGNLLNLVEPVSIFLKTTTPAKQLPTDLGNLNLSKADQEGDCIGCRT